MKISLHPGAEHDVAEAAVFGWNHSLGREARSKASAFWDRSAINGAIQIKQFFQGCARVREASSSYFRGMMFGSFLPDPAIDAS